MNGFLELKVGRRSILTGAGAGIAALSGPGALAIIGATGGGRFRFAPPDIPEGFLLDSKPFQIRSGELHPARIPRQHWRQRIQMAKAIGLNTIAVLPMWNYHETEPGQWDFTTENRNISDFIRLIQDEGLFVYLRPGPYICAEWDLGGYPPYLLRNPTVALRQADDPYYLSAAARWLARLANIVRPLMIDNGGPILMVQIENEYAAFGTDLSYLESIRAAWIEQGINGPFAIADSLSQVQGSGTYLPGTALGLDGSTDIATARKISGDYPVWIGEGYPGWLTHWGEPWVYSDYRETLQRLMKERISFNIYLAHGGTNFGWTAGANSKDDGTEFKPSITSYDYDAPVNERGAPGYNFHEFRKIIHDGANITLTPIPPTPPAVGFPPVKTRQLGSIWNALPQGVRVRKPGPMETVLGQTTGLVVYRTTIPAGNSGELRINGLHDEAVVMVNGERRGSLSRLIKSKVPKFLTIAASERPSILDILVFPYGRVNYGRYMQDRKGILGAAYLGDKELEQWDVFGVPLDAAHLDRLRRVPSSKDGLMHEAEFSLTRLGDTFIDMAKWKVGLVWVNGHLLGRFNDLGPQTRLYCPQEWLRKGRNTVTILDLYAEPGLTISGEPLSDKEAFNPKRVTIEELY